MRLVFVRRVALVLALSCGAADPASALNVSELQRLLQSTPAGPVAFVEIRESPWLAQPVESRGTMVSGKDVLEKRVHSPRAEVWRLLPDRVELVAAGEAAGKQILFSRSPAVAILSETLRRLVAGDLAALERDFRIDVRGDPGAWTARLTPAASEAARVIDHVELEGSGGEVRVIVVVDRPGERTTTRLQR